ncbi:MAG: transposase [bacterium]|nr:transposase [bacterium]
MNERQDHSSEALFRYFVVSKVVAQVLGNEPRSDAIRAVAADAHMFFGGSLRRCSARTIYRWISAYELDGISGLEPKLRMTRSSALPAKLLDFLVEENRGDRRASIPELIRRARERDVLEPDEIVHRSTVFRACKRMGLSITRRKKAKHRDSRRFAYPHRMDMVLCDGKHFRAGEQRHKRVALFFIDDATRSALHTVVGTSETQELFQRGVYGCIAKHGLMSACYVDHGPGFIAADTIAVFANLDIPLIFGEVGYKEGRGKVERFNRTADADVLRNLDGRPDVDSDCRALELRLQHYTDQEYAHRPHEGLDNGTPWQRFHNDPKPLRFPEDRQALRSKFEVWLTRRVSSDHIVSIDSALYELPKGHAGRIVMLRRRLLDGTIGFLHDGRVIDLHHVDLAANARARRARPGEQDDQPEPMPRKSAADLAFEHDFGPVVSDDGGLASPPCLDHESDDSDLPW